jgi:hypothetical protein
VKKFVILWLFFAVLIFSSQTLAILGEKVASITADKTRFKAKSYKRMQSDSYSIHEMEIDGNIVKEFASPDGDVFAVSWRGLKPPNLETLFGKHYDDYKKQFDQQPRQKGRQPIQVKASNVVVRHGGHMRDLFGNACIPNLMPADHRCEDFQ